MRRRLVTTGMALCFFCMAHSQVLQLKNCKGQNILIEPGREVHLKIYKDVPCDKCAICNYDKYEGKFIGFDGRNVEISTSFAYESRMDNEGISSLLEIRPRQRFAPTSIDRFSFEEIGFIAYQPPIKYNLMGAGFSIFSLSLIYNVVVLPTVLAAGRNFSWNRYLRNATPGFILMGVSIPLVTIGTTMNELPIRLPTDIQNPGCNWSLKKETQ